MLMLVYFAIFCVMFTAYMAPLAIVSPQWIKAFDSPAKRKIRVMHIPPLEGLAVFASLPLGLLMIHPENPHYMAIITGAFLIMTSRFVDDYQLTPKIKWYPEPAVKQVTKGIFTLGRGRQYEGERLKPREHDMVEIAQIPFINTTMNQFMDEKIQPSIEARRKCFIVTANPEIVMATKRDLAYQKIVHGADYVVPDGIGIIFAAKFKKMALKERIAGIDLMKEMLAFANKQHASCYFLGASEESNKAAVKKISESYSNIQVVGHHHGYFKINDQILAANIAKTEPDFIFVGLGYPRQELWIEQNKGLFSKGIFMGVGGSLDVFSGEVKRAPDFWIKLNLEWLYRLLRQPSRFKRMFPLIKFVWLVVCKKT